jgi:hypothetical protein
VNGGDFFQAKDLAKDLSFQYKNLCVCVTKNPLPVSPLVKSVVSIERQSRRSGWRTSSLSPAAPEEKGGEIFEKNAMKNMRILY